MSSGANPSRRSTLEAVLRERQEREKDPTNLRGMRRYLTSMNWDKAWIDLIVVRVKKRLMASTAVLMKDVVEYLESEGIRNDVICNMCALNPDILATQPSELQSTIDFLRNSGIQDVPEFIRHHPSLLDYRPVENGYFLQKPGTMARALVYQTTGEDGQQFVNVQYFRSTAQFLKSPISPWVLPDSARQLLDDANAQIGAVQ